MNKPALRLFCGKGKNLVLPLAFCALCAFVSLAALLPLAGTLSRSAADAGFVPVTELRRAQMPQTAALEQLPEAGERLGRLSIAGTAVDCALYYGDADAQLELGAGLYTGAGLPGQGACVLVGGHTNTYFRDLEKVQPGDEIRLELDYGEYRYQVTGWKIARADDATAYDLDPEQEQLVLYTCYPFGALYETPLRYFVFGQRISGPQLQLP